jgi:hypothetical protein
VSYGVSARGRPYSLDKPSTVKALASNVSTQVMLKTMFEMIATMADDPDRYRSDMRSKLLEIADTMPLAKDTVGNLLINERLNLFAAGGAEILLRRLVSPNTKLLLFLQRFRVSPPFRKLIESREATTELA